MLDFIHTRHTTAYIAHTRYGLPISTIESASTIIPSPPGGRADSSSTRRSPTECQTPTRTHPRVDYYSSRWSSSSPFQPFEASVFPVQPTAPVINFMTLLLYPLHSSMSTIQHLSTNPRFPPFNLPLCSAHESGIILDKKCWTLSTLDLE